MILLPEKGVRLLEMLPVRVLLAEKSADTKIDFLSYRGQTLNATDLDRSRSNTGTGEEIDH
jgi:hypothetical protein